LPTIAKARKVENSCQANNKYGFHAKVFEGKMMQDKKITELGDGQFDAAIADGLTLVDFWAPWCGPCRMQGPILEEVAESIDEQAKIAKVNVDDAGGVAERFDVQSIPTLLLFKDGNEVRRFVGVQPKEILVDAIVSTV
jgi:thioredoxin 1